MIETDALKHARAFIESDEWCLLLMGKAGVGKTYAAEWALGELKSSWRAAYEDALRPVPHHNWPRLMIATELALELYEKEGERSFVDLAREVGVLVLDDLGTEHVGESGAFFSALDLIINTRQRQQLRTIVTTNLAPNDLRERYGDRIYDRLRDGMAVECAGESLRGRKEKEEENDAEAQ